MGFLDKVGSFLKREAKDLGDAAEGMKDSLDDELTKREQELTMTPSEKIAAIQRDAMATDDRIDSIVDKASGREADADAVAEVQAIEPMPDLPNVTHIVLPDGRIKSGDDVVEPGAEQLDRLRDSTPDSDPSTPDAAMGDPVDSHDALPPPPAIATAVSESGETHGADNQDLPAAEAPISEPDSLVDQATSQADVTESDPEISELAEPDTDAADIDPADQPETETDPAEFESADTSGPDFGKTPAQLKYERARSAADDLLEELRGELKADGEI